MNNRKSVELFERAIRLIPGGVNSPVRAFDSVGGAPPYIEKGIGSKVIDADGNEYLDFCGSWGPLILGHAHPDVTRALAEQAADQHRRRLTLWWLSATIALGVAFLGLKGYEYYMEYRAGLVPFLDQPFAFSGPDPHNAMLFYNFYFAITGLHALHMIIGLMVLLVMLVLTYRWREGARVARQVRIAGLYWAFVDIVWVLVYCSLYLLGR